MSTESKTAFDKNIARARAFITIHENTQDGAGAPTRARRELPRAAVVFAVGAIDAYLSEVSAEVLIAQLQITPANQAMRELLKRIQGDLPTLALEISILGTQAERTLRLRDTVADHFHNKVSQHGSKAVAATLARIGGDVQEIWAHLEASGYQRPAKTLDDWTDKRHDIVHKGKKPTVRRTNASDFIDFCDDLISKVDEIAESLKP